MDVKTKAFCLKKKTYIKICLENLLRTQGLIGFAILLVVFLSSIFLKSFWINIFSASAAFLYILFWTFAFYSVTTAPQTKMLFEKYSYDISESKIMMMMDIRKGMCITWDKIKKCRETHDGFLFFLSKSHIIYIPYKMFKSTIDIARVRVLLRNKKYIVNKDE